MTVSGTTFAGYHLDALITTDSVSTIYRATAHGDPEDATRHVALRITDPLRAGEGPDVAAIAAYIRRLSTAVRVSHPALVTIADAGEIDDRVYVATALIPGVTLGEYLRARGPLPVTDAVALLRHIANGLDRAHAAGVVHGAISPRTICVRHRDAGTGAPSAVLTGFGLDTLLQRLLRSDRGAVHLDDVRYVAPERLRGVDADGRADQYALACALYHCVTGAPPFDRDTVSGLFGAHMFAPVPTLAERNGDRDVGGAMAMGMAKQPDDRHASCANLLRATGRLAAAARRTTGVAPAAVRTVAWPDDPEPVDGSPRPVAATARPTGGRPRRRRGIRLGGERWPRLAWPVAAMLVLAGILCTLGAVALLRHTVAADPPVAGDRRRVAAGSLAAGRGDPAAAGVRWQRRVTDESIDSLQIVDGTVLAAAPHGVFALDATRGVADWASAVNVGVLTDTVVTDEIVALRAAKFRALALDDGTRLWENSDILAPVAALAAADGVIYGVGPGRLAPELVAVDAETGEAAWYFEGGPAGVDNEAEVAAMDGLVAVLDEAGLTAVDPDGQLETDTVGRRAMADAGWEQRIVDPWVGSLSLLPDAVVLATRQGEVCAFDPADGDERWCTDVGAVEGRQPTIAVDGDAIVVVGESQVVRLALESGAVRWVHPAPRRLVPAAAITDDQVVIADVAGQAHGLDLERGYEAWRASGFAEVTSLAAAGGQVYVGTAGGLVVRLAPPAGGVRS